MIVKGLLALIIAFISFPARTEVVSWQGFDIHYTTLNSMLIPFDVASLHGIVRSKNRIITNISIRKNGKAVAANLSGTSANLLSQLSTLEFDEVTESDAIYYLSNQLIDERDTLVFRIEIKPLNHPDTYHLKFTRQYY